MHRCIGAETPNERALTTIQMRLLAEFDASIQDIEDYQQRVTEECAIFPEANLFPYVLPALAYGNLALALYQRIGGEDATLLQIHQHLNQLLSQALVQSKGKPLNSYPHLTWPFDTLPCVVSLLHSTTPPN